MNATQADEITAYVEAVRRALGSIAPSIREELLEDLPEHLAEVTAEGNGTLVERLGAPEAYALELLATAQLVGGFPDPPAPNRLASLIEMRADVQRMLARADVRVGPVIGYEKASDFLLLLRPAWWVLRGYIAAMALAYLIENDRGDIGLLPRIAGNDLVALVLLAGCVIASILLGRRTPMLSRWPRYALWSGTAVLVLFALSTFMSADSDTRHPSYDQVNGSYDSNPYSNIGDVFVYDSQGRLVTGARLYDQDGSPIQLGNNYCTDPTTGDSNRTRALGYPFCPQDAPFGPSPSAPAPTPSDPSAADPSLTATPTSPAASPTATATSPASSAASASARVSPTATPSR